MIPKSSDKYTAIVDSYNNFAYNYVSNIHMLKAVLLSPYTKDGKIIQDTQEVTGGSITTYYDIDTGRSCSNGSGRQTRNSIL